MNEINQVNLWLDLFTWENVGNVMAVLVILGAIIGFIHAVTSQKNSHSMLDIFLPLGSSKMRINGTWIIAMFILVYQTINNSLTEWAYGLALTAFVSDRMFARNDGKKEEVKKPEVKNPEVKKPEVKNPEAEDKC